MRKGVSDTLKGHKERGYKGHLGLLWLILLALSLFSNTLMDVLLMPPQDGPRLFFRNRYDVPGIWSRWIVSGEKRVLRRVHEEGQERGTSREAAGQATPKGQGHSASCSHHAGKVRGETSWFDLESLQETPFQPACRHLFLYHLGMHRNEEIGKVFGVGYTAVIGAVKRGQAYINSDRQVENRVRKILNDI